MKNKRVKRKLRPKKYERWLSTPDLWAAFDAWAKMKALPRKIFEPQSIDRGTQKPLWYFKKRLKKLSVSNRKFLPPQCKSIEVSPAALKARASLRTVQLACPKLYCCVEECQQSVVRPEALQYQASHKIKHLAKPKRWMNDECAKNIFSVPKAALQRKATAKDYSLAVPKKYDFQDSEQKDSDFNQKRNYNKEWCEFLSIPSYRVLMYLDNPKAKEWKENYENELESRNRQAMFEQKRKQREAEKQRKRELKRKIKAGKRRKKEQQKQKDREKRALDEAEKKLVQKKNKDPEEIKRELEKKKKFHNEFYNLQEYEDEREHDYYIEEEEDQDIVKLEGKRLKDWSEVEIEDNKEKEGAEEVEVEEEEEDDDDDEEKELVDEENEKEREKPKSKKEVEKMIKRKREKNYWRKNIVMCKVFPPKISEIAKNFEATEEIGKLAQPKLYKSPPCRKDPYKVKESAKSYTATPGIKKLAKPKYFHDPVERYPKPRNHDKYGRTIFPKIPYGKKLSKVFAWESSIPCPENRKVEMYAEAGDASKKAAQNKSNKKFEENKGEKRLFFIHPIAYETTIDPLFDKKGSLKQIKERKKLKNLQNKNKSIKKEKQNEIITQSKFLEVSKSEFEATIGTQDENLLPVTDSKDDTASLTE